MPTKKRKTKEEVVEPVKVEPKAEPKKQGLIAYADFNEYKVGDVFKVPEGWTLNLEYQKVLLTKAKKREGVVFDTPTGLVILPLKEG